LAVTAGNDLIIASNFDVQIPSVLEAVDNGSITEKRIDESVLRILLWKLQLGIIPVQNEELSSSPITAP